MIIILLQYFLKIKGFFRLLVVYFIDNVYLFYFSIDYMLENIIYVLVEFFFYNILLVYGKFIVFLYSFNYGEMENIVKEFKIIFKYSLF